MPTGAGIALQAGAVDTTVKAARLGYFKNTLEHLRSGFIENNQY